MTVDGQESIVEYFIFHGAFHAAVFAIWSMNSQHKRPFFLKYPWKMCFIDALGLLSRPSFRSLSFKHHKKVTQFSSCYSFTQYWIQFCYCPSSSLDGFRVKWVLKRIKIPASRSFPCRLLLAISLLGTVFEEKCSSPT